MAVGCHTRLADVRVVRSRPATVIPEPRTALTAASTAAAYMTSTRVTASPIPQKPERDAPARSRSPRPPGTPPPAGRSACHCRSPAGRPVGGRSGRGPVRVGGADRGARRGPARRPRPAPRRPAAGGRARLLHQRAAGRGAGPVELGLHEGSVDELRARADAGDGDADLLAELLTRRGQGEEAERLRRFGLNPDGSIACAEDTPEPERREQPPRQRRQLPPWPENERFST